MLILLRVFSLLAGILLVAAPSFLLLRFAYGVGEPPPTERYLSFFSETFMVGCGLGLGLVFVGFPGLASGSRTPVMRIITGLLLTASAAAFLAVGFEGTINRFAVPAILTLQALSFYHFIFPANKQSERHGNQK